MLEVVFEGIKKFGAEVISAVLFAMLVWEYKRSRTFLKRYNRMKQEVETLRDEVKRLEGSLNESESQRQEEIHLREDTQQQLEIERSAHEHTRAELQARNEALKGAENRKTEEAGHIAEFQRELEVMRQENQRLQFEVKRFEDAQKQAEKQKQEEAKRKSEAQTRISESPVLTSVRDWLKNTL